MKYYTLVLLLVLSSACAREKLPLHTEAGTSSIVDYAAFVDPFIGTADDRGQLHPAAAMPFGMVKLGPDTFPGNHSGYDYLADMLRGFSHTRIGGVGCSGAGGDIRIIPGYVDTASVLTIDKSSEIAAPGFYAVTVSGDRPIAVELTATARTGLHRYTFSGDSSPLLAISLDEPFATPLSSSWEIGENNDEISGRVSATTVCNKGVYTLYYSLKLSRPFTSFTTVDGVVGSNPVLHFDAPGETTIMVKTGLSGTSAANAARNREAEIPGWDFEQVKKNARKSWNELLARLEVEGRDEAQGMFYTMLYRSLLTPVIVSDIDGKYAGVDGQLHDGPPGGYYSCWSIWDTYRTKYPLLSLVVPERIEPMMLSLIDLYDQGKADWATERESYPTTRTERAAVLLLDAYNKKLLDDRVTETYDKIAAEVEARSPTTPDKIIENAHDGWALASIGALAGRADAASRMAEALSYRTTWSADFAEPGDDADVVHGRDLYEGTIWQYRWSPVFDLAAIVELAGGEQVFADQLQYFFDNELYNHANEPDLHAPFLFGPVGRPAQTASLVRAILTEPLRQWYGTHEKWAQPFEGRIYNPTPEAFVPEMDDDAGTMAAWYVLAAIGMYQVNVGQPEYRLTTPLFPRLALQPQFPGNGGRLIIEAPHTMDEKFSDLIELNGMKIESGSLAYEEIAAGGRLVFKSTTQ